MLIPLKLRILPMRLQPLLHKSENLVKRAITSIILILLFYGVVAYFQPWVFSAILAALCIYILVYEWPAFNQWALTPLYPLAPFVCAIYCNEVDQFFLVFLSIIVFSHDTGSYCIGSLLGRSKIAPSISPGKTWEGFWGGYIASCVTAYLFLAYYNRALPTGFLLSGVLLVTLVSLAGDLFESALKRRVNKKDSGRLLPGHGGLLDRFDGLMFAITLFLPIHRYFWEMIQKQ